MGGVVQAQRLATPPVVEAIGAMPGLSGSPRIRSAPLPSSRVSAHRGPAEPRVGLFQRAAPRVSSGKAGVSTWRATPSGFMPSGVSGLMRARVTHQAPTKAVVVDDSSRRAAQVVEASGTSGLGDDAHAGRWWK